MPRKRERDSDGRTVDLVVAICQAPGGQLYYWGYGLKNGLAQEANDPTRTASGFVAVNNTAVDQSRD